MTEGQFPYKGVIMLNKPPIDKVGALWLLQRRAGHNLPIRAFWSNKFCSEEQMLRWDLDGILTIDVGDEKYHQTTAGSATEFVGSLVGVNTVGERELVDLFNKNNKTGNLRGMHMSVAWTMRELYELPGFDQVNIINCVVDVVDAFVRVLDGERARDASVPMPDNLAALAAELQKCNFAPMTPGRYLRDLWTLGAAPAEIQQKVQYWIDGWNQIRAEVERGRRAYADLDKEPITFKVGSFTAIKLLTGDRFLVKAVGHDRGIHIRIVQNPDTGLVVIMSQGAKLGALGSLLKRVEPGLWYHQMGGNNNQSLINGGPQYTETPPTNHTLDELCELVRQNVS